MKKLILSALFLGCMLSGFSQSKFTEQTLVEIHKSFTVNPVQAFTESVLPTFAMIGSDGKITDFATFKSWQVGGGLAEWPITEVKIQQEGNLAIATGITQHRAKHAKEAFYQRFTETYEFKNGKWMMANLHYTDIK